MKNRIITIGRQFGSGGRTIGKEVAAKLGIPCYDSELIERASEESGLSKEYVAERGEYTAHDGWFSSVFAAGAFLSRNVQSGLPLGCSEKNHTRFGGTGTLRYSRKMCRLYLA